MTRTYGVPLAMQKLKMIPYQKKDFGKLTRGKVSLPIVVPLLVAGCVWLCMRYYSTACPTQKSNTPEYLTSPASTKATTSSKESFITRAKEMETRAELPVYVPTADILLMSQAKGGSTSLFQLLYAGLTGLPSFNVPECKTYVQNFTSPCWRGLVLPLEQARSLTRTRLLFGSNDGTLRIAVQREPYERLLSAYRDKLTCDRIDKVINREHKAQLLKELLHVAKMDGFQGSRTPSGESCLSPFEFGLVLSRIRSGIQNGTVSSLKDIEAHFRPQEYFFKDIHYDLVLNVQDLSNPDRIWPILERLPLLKASGIDTKPKKWHTTQARSVKMEAGTERRIREFAELSKYEKEKYLKV